MTTSFNWRDKFKNLPKLPYGKNWLKGCEPGNATLEQIITNKLLHNLAISQEERRIVTECIFYYNILYSELEKFDFSVLTNVELDDFLEYIGYAFNYLPMHLNDIELFNTYRLVNNYDGKSKENKCQLSYPPLQIVRERELYNRANTPKSTIFYSSESIDAIFKELKPAISSIVTLGNWVPNKNNKFLSYPIMANPSAQFVNENARGASLAYSGMKKKLHPLFGYFIDGYFRVLNREYSKTVKDHKEYIICAYFSERIFEIDENGWNVDCIIYPSVGNEFIFSNLAFKSKVADERLKLESAIEFEVLETYYDNPTTNIDPRVLSVAKVKRLKQSKLILDNGDIIWN